MAELHHGSISQENPINTTTPTSKYPLCNPKFRTARSGFFDFDAGFDMRGSIHDHLTSGNSVINGFIDRTFKLGNFQFGSINLHSSTNVAERYDDSQEEKPLIVVISTLNLDTLCALKVSSARRLCSDVGVDVDIGLDVGVSVHDPPRLRNSLTNGSNGINFNLTNIQYESTNIQYESTNIQFFI